MSLEWHKAGHDEGDCGGETPCPWCEIAKLQAELEIYKWGSLEAALKEIGKLQAELAAKDEGNAYIELGVALAENAELQAALECQYAQVEGLTFENKILEGACDFWQEMAAEYMPSEKYYEMTGED